MNRTTSTLLSIGVSAFVIALGIWFLYDHNMWIWSGHGHWGMGHHSIMGGGMGLIMIIFWALLIGAVVLLISGAVTGIRSIKKYKDEVPTSIEILKQRYARGEIDRDEFEEKRRDLIV
jgi:putative membrane protein